jgi:hypothetical protein
MASSESQTHPDQVFRRLAGDLERWGGLFLEVARTRDYPAIEQVLGGLVEWMGNDLIDGWLYLPLLTFDTLNEHSEALFQACRAYLGKLRGGPVPLPVEEGRTREEAIGAVLDRIRGLAASGAGEQQREQPGGD